MILVLSGLPASGKTHLAQQWVQENPERRRRINYDDFRLALYGPDWTFNFPEEEAMKEKAKALAEAYISQGFDVVVDNTNLSSKAKAPWVELAAKYGTGLQIETLTTSLATCVARDKARAKRVGRAVIERMALWNGLLTFREDEKLVLVDVDGTLADPSARLHLVKKHKGDKTPCSGCGMNPDCAQDCANSGECDRQKKEYPHEWAKPNWPAFFKACGGDAPKEKIITLTQHLALTYDKVIVCSGRPIDHCGIATEDWLDEHLEGWAYDHLLMRQGGDYRADDIVKQEILDKLPKDQVEFVLDDRQRVVDMWRKNGLTCLQVAKGDF